MKREHELAKRLNVWAKIRKQIEALSEALTDFRKNGGLPYTPTDDAQNLLTHLNDCLEKLGKFPAELIIEATVQLKRDIERTFEAAVLLGILPAEPKPEERTL